MANERRIVVVISKDVADQAESDAIKAQITTFVASKPAWHVNVTYHNGETVQEGT